MSPNVTIIPYGTGAISDGTVKIRRSSAGVDVTCPSPFIAIDPANPETLRLNGDQYRFPEPPDLRTMTDAGVQMDFLEAHLSAFCDLFSKLQKDFLARYFAYVAETVEAHREVLDKHLAPFGGIYDYRDWMLSAPRPLPRAHLPYDEAARYAAVDFAFFIDGQCLAIALDGGHTPTGSMRERRQRLEKTGAEIIAIAPGSALGDVLPERFREFWRGQHLPSSPLKGVTLGDIIPA